MGDHPDKLCDMCNFDARLFPVTDFWLGYWYHLCHFKPGEKPCKWFEDQMARLK